MKEGLTKVVTILLFAIILIGFPVGCFYAYRWFNWKFGYETMVDKKIQQHLEEYHEIK